MNNNDTIIFMSAYETTKYSKSSIILKKKPEISALLNEHHLSYILHDDKLISPRGVLKLYTEYDYVQQRTSFSFLPVNEKNGIDKLDEIIKQTGFCIKLLHAQSILSDISYFKLNFFFFMERFLVHSGERILQINPIAFLLNSTMIIAFEVIDFETGNTLGKDDIYGKTGNYNLLSINGYQFFGEEFVIPFNGKISEVIFNNVSSFFSEMTRDRFVPQNYSFIHDIIVLSNDISNIKEYFCCLIGTKDIPSPLVNISTTDSYQYYPQDGACVITKYSQNNIEIPLYNGIMLESIKMHILLNQIINLEITSDLNRVMCNNLYLENLFFSPHVPIETYNFLGYLYETNSFQHRKEATKLKISYLDAENETKKNRNGILLNVLLYIISLIGAIGTLDTLESRLNIPFKYSFSIVILIFLLLGIIWGITEWHRNN